MCVPIPTLPIAVCFAHILREIIVVRKFYRAFDTRLYLSRMKQRMMPPSSPKIHKRCSNRKLQTSSTLVGQVCFEVSCFCKIVS